MLGNFLDDWLGEFSPERVERVVRCSSVLTRKLKFAPHFAACYLQPVHTSLAISCLAILWPHPKCPYSQHKDPDENGCFDFLLVVPATNFTAGFSLLGKEGIKTMFESKGIVWGD